VRIEPYGRDAALLHLDDDRAVRRWHAAIEAARIDGVLDVVPGERTVVVTAGADRDDPRALPAALAALDALDAEEPRADRPRQRRLVEIPVRYDGEDLEEVAHRSGLGPDEVVRLHHEADYGVAFCGFAPGFAYLTGLPAALHLPRRATPRPRVPAGSVAIATRYAGVYPQASPGGWWLLGRTDLRMFDPDRSPPALLEPGDRVRFTPA
jgi:KipI family sensor histidine kinase inhibitor